MSPRRSSRARTSQPAPSLPKNSNSSSSSISSGRASQSAAPEQKAASRSQSSEDIDAAQARRSRRSLNVVKDEVTHAIDDEVEDDGEEEVTRCICGNQEYPGLPLSAGDSSKGSSKNDPDSAAFAEDSTGWFIQCDDCKVWQHGGCVGIMDESTSPEEYFCEQCRKDLHRVTTTVNGDRRKYSLYLPAQDSRSSQSSPVAVPKSQSKRSKNGKTAQFNAENLSKGRRSTMNSRDAALEEEQLRIAIEESKRDGGTANTANGTRKGKRSRSESEERPEGTKRQRTTSNSASSASQSKSHRRDSVTKEEMAKPERSKNIRGAAARNQRNKEARDREAQREKERADAGRRKGRAERDGSRTPTSEPRTRTTNARGNKSSATSFPTPRPPEQQPSKVSHKKTGRPPARKGRVGRNQYTKDRDPPPHDAHQKPSPAPSNSSQNGDGGTPHANGYANGDGNGLGRPSKPKHMPLSRTSMNDMKRRVAGILEYISHTQVDMAGSAMALTTKSSTSTNTPPNGNGNSKTSGLSEKAVDAALSDLDAIDEQVFASLSSLEMMEVLTRRLMKWQNEYGKWGDK